ncbi:MAG: tetratricopeptide repeat protein [bacterium]|nr:tetratricopeptide repeat protein [bacterium]
MCPGFWIRLEEPPAGEARRHTQAVWVGGRTNFASLDGTMLRPFFSHVHLPIHRFPWCWVLVFFWGLWGTGTGNAQSLRGTQAEVKQLFEDAQRYHLGIDRPVDLPRAYQLYQEVVKRDSRHRDAYYNLAHICVTRKRYNLAVKFYRRVIGLDPEDADAYNNLGTVLDRQGKPDQARKMYEQAIRLKRDLGIAYHNLAYLILEEGDEDRALRIVEEGLKVSPDHPELVMLRSRIMGHTGKISNVTIGVVVCAFVGVLVVYHFLVAKSSGV